MYGMLPAQSFIIKLYWTVKRTHAYTSSHVFPTTFRCGLLRAFSSQKARPCIIKIWSQANQFFLHHLELRFIVREWRSSSGKASGEYRAPCMVSAGTPLRMHRRFISRCGVFGDAIIWCFTSNSDVSVETIIFLRIKCHEKALTDTSKFVFDQQTCWCLWMLSILLVFSQRDVFQIKFHMMIGTKLGCWGGCSRTGSVVGGHLNYCISVRWR